VDAHSHVQVPQVILMVFGVALGVVLLTDFKGLATGMLEQTRWRRDGGWVNAPNWVARAFAVWCFVFGIGQFFLFRYMPWPCGRVAV
jgi:hypothetical protein